MKNIDSMEKLNKILELDQEGKTRNEIVEIIGYKNFALHWRAVDLYGVEHGGASG